MSAHKVESSVIIFYQSCGIYYVYCGFKNIMNFFYYFSFLKNLNYMSIKYVYWNGSFSRILEKIGYFGL